MNILFVTSGNKATGINTIVKAQGSSLQELGVNVNYFPIIGKGFIGYFKAIVKLRKLIKTQKFDIVHAHYSLSGFVAGLAGSKPLFVSLMGSDVKAKSWYKYFIKFFNFFF